MSTPDLIAIASLGVSLAALGVAIYAIRRANVTASAATFVTLNEGFRQSWARYLSATSEDKKYELAELLNLIEIACSIYLEGSLSGNTRELVFEYLDQTLTMLTQNQDRNTQISQLLQNKDTFKFIKRFLRKTPLLSVTVPPEWCQLSER